MDTITQGLLGAAMAQLGFRQRLGRETTFVAAAVGIVPDLDMLVSPVLRIFGSAPDEFARLTIHRGISHSILFLPLLAIPLAVLWYKLRRWRDAKNDRTTPRFLLYYLCVAVVLVTHPLLDLFTAYGTQLFAPLTDARYSLDAVPIIDLIYTPILVATLGVCLLLRLSKADARRATLVAGWAGMLLATVYLFAGMWMHDRAIDCVRERFAETGPAAQTRYEAYPQFGSIFVWRVVRRTPDEWMAVRVMPVADPKIERLSYRTAPEDDNEWVRRARALPEIEKFNWFAADTLRAEYEFADGRHVVTFYDMRYALRPDSVGSLWGARVEFAANGEVLGVRRVRSYGSGGLREFARRVWRNFFGDK